MVEFNRQERTIRVKIAYYGPAVGGKTTNLKVLYDRARQRAARRVRLGELAAGPHDPLRPAAAQVRRASWATTCASSSRRCPGQAIYAPARRVVLRGSDGVVFVANSATDRWHENQQCFRELQGHLLAQQLDPATIPMVMQYNKRDLPDVMELEALNRGLNARRVPVLRRGGDARRGSPRDLRRRSSG